MDQTVYIEYDGERHAIDTVAVLLGQYRYVDERAARNAIATVITDIVSELVFSVDSSNSAEIIISIS